jgi:hypothetical protein
MGRHVAGKEEIVKACILVRKPDGKRILDMRGRMILKWTIHKQGVRVWVETSGSKQGWVAESCVHFRAAHNVQTFLSGWPTICL